MKRILIIQTQIKHYRVPFFVKLHRALHANNICMRVAYADPITTDERNDNAELPDDFGVKVTPQHFLGGRVLYFPLLREVAKADLIISEQANRQLLNYVLLVCSIIGLKKIAFWGLGENKGASRSAPSEWIRRRIAKKVHWWFAYTEGTKKYLMENGVREGHITVVRNAVDTGESFALLSEIDDREVIAARLHLKISMDAAVGLYLGALLPDKGLDLLFQAAELTKARIAGFHLIVVGGGEERAMVERACIAHPWMHYVGPKFGREKAIFLKMASALLIPGRVGLAILDGFAAGLPLLTTEIRHHGPEIEYLQSGYNGLISPSTPGAYADSIVSFFSNQLLRDMISRGARESSLRYSVDSMVKNFEMGIQSCINHDPIGALADGGLA